MIQQAEFHLKTYNNDGTLAAVAIYPISSFRAMHPDRFDPVYDLDPHSMTRFVAKPRTLDLHAVVFDRHLTIDPNNYHDYKGCPAIPEAVAFGDNPFLSNYIPEAPTQCKDLAKRARHINIEE